MTPGYRLMDSVLGSGIGDGGHHRHLIQPQPDLRFDTAELLRAAQDCDPLKYFRALGILRDPREQQDFMDRDETLDQGAEFDARIRNAFEQSTSRGDIGQQNDVLAAYQALSTLEGRDAYRTIIKTRQGVSADLRRVRSS